MRKITILILILIISNNLFSQRISIPKQTLISSLDKILSPFEDMADYALNRNEAGINKAYSEIIKFDQSATFKNLLSNKNYVELKLKLKELESYITKKDYRNVALKSVEIFGFNSSNFKYKSEIDNQINIEGMDYLGFESLAILNHKNLDWNKLDETFISVQNKWSTLKPNVKDPNLTDSIDYLMNALQLSISTKNSNMTKILASLELSLIDVLEKGMN